MLPNTVWSHEASCSNRELNTWPYKIERVRGLGQKISCSRVNKCVQRGSLRNAGRFGVQTHYYRLPMWPVMCVTKNVMVQQSLGWFGAYPEKTISVPWFGRDYWHGGRADNSNETANNAKYSNCKGLNHETYDVSLQNLRSRPFWILSPLRFFFLFLSILRLFTS